MKNKKMYAIIGMLILLLQLPILKADVQTPQQTPQSDMISYDYSHANELHITFHLPELVETQLYTEKGSFTQVEIPNFGFIGAIGSPQLPAVTTLAAVSSLPSSLEILTAHLQETRNDQRIYPMQRPQSDNEKNQESEFIYDESAYLLNAALPGTTAELVDNGKIRDIPFIKLRFYPVQYNPAQQIVTIYDTITVRLVFSTNTPVLVEPHYTQSQFYPFYETVFHNWEGFESATTFQQHSGSKDLGCDYLIITHSNYYTQALQLAEWKYQTGFLTKVVNVSEIGTTYAQIRSYLTTAYTTWTPRPSYVLLFGDAEHIPATNLYGTPTDLWYAAINGTDYYPDLFIGRISVDTVDQATTVVGKILTYEQTPPTQASFYTNMAVAAYFQDDNNDHYEDRRFVLTSEEIRDFLQSIGYTGQRIYVTGASINPTHYNNGYYANGEPLPPELLRPTFAWDGDATDIINAINQGIFILNHRDHGMQSGWGDPYFTTTHVSTLTNGELLPVVFSLNCLTGAFTSGECFCEEFLRKSNGGAVGIYGATDVSYSGYNDYLCRGLYDAIWPQFDPEVGNNVPLTHMGPMLNYGKAFMAETWGDTWGYERLEFELFHCFGDPSLDIYTMLPGTLDVTTTLGTDTIQVLVSGNGNPLEGARVCLRQDNGFYQAGLTDAAGSILLSTTGISLDESVILAATAHNYLYYLENFLLNQKPQKPNTPTGSTEGKINVEYPYTTSTVDPDGDNVSYYFSWGDGTYSTWIGPLASGEEVTASHNWSKKGTYAVKVKAKDAKGEESDWSDPLSVIMPLDYSISHPFLQWLSSLLMNRFPFLSSLCTLVEKLLS